MKIGILTFHEAPNPGAFLQALSTQRLLEQLGHSVEFIHYMCPGTANREPWKHYLRAANYLRARTYLHARTRFGIIRKISAFKSAVRQHLKTSAPCHTVDDIARLHYDAVLIGADMVWDYKTFPIADNPVYFGHGLSTDRLIALAPCCGNVDPEEDIPEFVSSGLPKFDSLSARDANTQRLVQRVLNKTPVILPDPAFALDVNTLPTHRLIDTPYLFVYQTGRLGGSLAKAVRTFARERGLLTVAACYRQPAAQINRPGAGPLEWLSLIKYADYVLTDCFHGVVFSIKLRRPFTVNESQVQRPKIRDLLSQLQCEQRVVAAPAQWRDMFNRDPGQDVVLFPASDWAHKVRSYLADALR